MADGGDLKLGKMKVNKKAVIIAGVFAGGVLAYAYWNSSRSGGGSGGGDTATGTDPNIDPYTGIPYSDEYGYFSGGAGGGGPQYGAIYDPVTGQYIGVGGSVITGTSTNAEWAQKARSYLVGADYDSKTVSEALGNVLYGVPVTDAQLAIFNAARGFIGEPPYPYPAIQHAGTPGSNTTNPALTKPTGIKATAHRTQIDLDWTPSAGNPQGYTLYRNNARYQSVAFSKGTIGSLRPNTSYKIKIVPFRGSTVGPAAEITVRTKK